MRFPPLSASSFNRTNGHKTDAQTPFRRISIDAEPGVRPNISPGALHRSWSDTYDPIHSMRDGVFALADGDGVIRTLTFTASLSVHRSC